MWKLWVDMESFLFFSETNDDDECYYAMLQWKRREGLSKPVDGTLVDDTYLALKLHRSNDKFLLPFLASAKPVPCPRSRDMLYRKSHVKINNKSIYARKDPSRCEASIGPQEGPTRAARWNVCSQQETNDHPLKSHQPSRSLLDLLPFPALRGHGVGSATRA